MLLHWPWHGVHWGAHVTIPGTLLLAFGPATVETCALFTLCAHSAKKKIPRENHALLDPVASKPMSHVGGYQILPVWVPSLNTTEMHIWRSLAFEIFVSVATVKSLLFLENH